MDFRVQTKITFQVKLAWERLFYRKKNREIQVEKVKFIKGNQSKKPASGYSETDFI